MHQDEASRLRHSIRGTINALKLGTSALDTGLNRTETLEFLDYFDQAADRMCVLLDQFDALPPTPVSPQPAVVERAENPR
jgi:hypothetical protein